MACTGTQWESEEIGVLGMALHWDAVGLSGDGGPGVGMHLGRVLGRWGSSQKSAIEMGCQGDEDARERSAREIGARRSSTREKGARETGRQRDRRCAGEASRSGAHQATHVGVGTQHTRPPGFRCSSAGSPLLPGAVEKQKTSQGPALQRDPGTGSSRPPRPEQRQQRGRQQRQQRQHRAAERSAARGAERSCSRFVAGPIVPAVAKLRLEAA